jgi:hypothetical protein
MLGDQKHDRFAVFDGVLGLGKLCIRSIKSGYDKDKTN